MELTIDLILKFYSVIAGVAVAIPGKNLFKQEGSRTCTSFYGILVTALVVLMAASGE